MQIFFKASISCRKQKKLFTQIARFSNFSRNIIESAGFVVLYLTGDLFQFFNYKIFCWNKKFLVCNSAVCEFSSGDKSIKISYDLLEKDKELGSQQVPLLPLQVLYCPRWFYKLTFTFLAKSQHLLNIYDSCQNKSMVRRTF